MKKIIRWFVLAAFALMIVLAVSSVRASTITAISADTDNALLTVSIDDDGDTSADRILDAASFVRATIVEPPSLTIGGISVESDGSIPSDRLSILEVDSQLDTGFANITVMKLEFNQLVANQPGADIVLFDTGSTDALTVTINGTEKSFATSDWAANLRGVTIDYYQQSISSIADLQTTVFGTSPTLNDASVQINGLAIDLDDFGVGSLATVDSMTLASSTCDPVFVGAVTVPEPGTLVLLLGVGVGVAVCRYRKHVGWLR